MSEASEVALTKSGWTMDRMILKTGLHTAHNYHMQKRFTMKTAVRYVPPEILKRNATMFLITIDT